MLHETDLTGIALRNLPIAGTQVRACGLEVRLAATPANVDAAQALRYRVFYEAMGATPSTAIRWRQRDFDVYDSVADHLLVVDPERGAGVDSIVGTCRLIRGRRARTPGCHLPAPGFCASAEFDIEPLLHRPGEILELGRACVNPDYRSRATIDLLWQGIAAYVHAFNIGIMFGRASIPGMDASSLGEPLSLLYHKRLAPANLRPRAHAERYLPMDVVPAHMLDERRAVKAMPPLLKGYLRLGAMFGDGAVIDRDFNTVDVCVIVPTDAITDRYYHRYQQRLVEDGAMPLVVPGEAA
jgi:putative hemolysin